MFFLIIFILYSVYFSLGCWIKIFITLWISCRLHWNVLICLRGYHNVTLLETVRIHNICIIIIICVISVLVFTTYINIWVIIIIIGLMLKLFSLLFKFDKSLAQIKLMSGMDLTDVWGSFKVKKRGYRMWQSHFQLSESSLVIMWQR